MGSSAGGAVDIRASSHQHRSFSAELSQRLQKNMTTSTKRRRRGKTAKKKPPRRP
jgi:hypothetical protein